MCDYLHDPEHIASCITEEIPISLKKLLSDKDAFCRYKSAECLFVLSCNKKCSKVISLISKYLKKSWSKKGNSNGRKAIVASEIIHTLSILFDDQEPMARKNAHRAVEMVSEVPFG